MKEQTKGTINKQEIANLGLSSIKSYFLVDPNEISNKEVLIHLLQKARLGMQFEREMNLSKRAEEMMSFRIMRLTANDKKELKKHVKEQLPQYSH
jgi:hypothetical protein